MGVQSNENTNNFGSIFGGANTEAPASTGTKASDRPASQYWLNIGREAGDKFVSLPMGVAVDGMKPKPIKGQNAEYNEFTETGNQMLARVQAICAELAPGESRILKLQVEVRRINGDVEAPAITAESPFAAALDF